MAAKKDSLTKTISGLGLVLVWLPLLAPVFFSLASLVGDGVFRFDYLMPAELFPLTLAGGALLVWGALRARSHVRWIGWSLGLAAGLLVAGQAIAVVSGLASGDIAPEGFWWIVLLSSFGLFVLADIFLAVGGAMVMRNLYRNTSGKAV